MDYGVLPIETRMMALGLPMPLPRRVGRPRALSMLRRIEIAIAWGEHMNAHARIEAPRERGPVKKLQQKLAAARINGDAQFLIDRMSARLDRLGRVTRAIVLPPRIALPEADRAIAKQFGITERMVRKIRVDKRMQPFMPRPIWKVPDWQRRGAESHAARSAAKRLMTPERYAKNERVALVGAGLVVEDAQQECFRWDPRLEQKGGYGLRPRTHRPITHDEVYSAALRLLRLVEEFERRVPLEYRSRPAWLGFQRQWARIEARCEGWFFRNDQQVYFWKRHPEGRRIPAKIQDYEAKKCSQEYWADRTR
jgi:hypothetical protein